MASVTMSSTMAKPVALGRALPAAANKPFVRMAVAPRRGVVAIRAAQDANSMQEEAVKAVALGTFATSFLAAGNACAASEVAQMAANDGRFGILLTLFAPVVGWVLFNIGGPALNQLDGMGGKKARSIAAGLGLGAASLLAAQNADAAAELAQTAAGDNRFGILLTLFAPVVGWVLFNIGGPALNQLSGMGDKNKPAKRRGVVASLGLTAASLMAAQNADAATELAQVAAGDNRFGILLTLFAPVVGWVLFNIGGPALNQLSGMGDKNKPAKRRGVVAGLGLTAASLMAAQNADAATELAQVAAGDNRVGILLTLFAPVVGWVLFNIGGPALNQLSGMGDKKKPTKRRAVVAGLGLTAASMLAAQNANAATELAQVAANDSRFGLIATLFLPVLGWVGFNILEGAKNQIDNMSLK